MTFTQTSVSKTHKVHQAHQKHQKSTKGFTLIELMVTVALIGVLMSIAAPSFTGIQRNSVLTSTANNILAALNVARAEALKRNATVGFAPTSGNNLNAGYVVFVDKNYNNKYDTGDEVLFNYPSISTLYPYITITSNATNSVINYSSTGYLVGAGSTMMIQETDITVATNDVTPVQIKFETRKVKIAITGRVRVCKGTDTGC